MHRRIPAGRQISHDFRVKSATPTSEDLVPTAEDLIPSAEDLFIEPCPAFPSLGLSRPCSSFPGGDDWASGGDICHFFAGSPSPLPATSIHQVCSPLLFPSAFRGGAPQTLTKLFVLGYASSYNILSTNFNFVCKRTPVSYAGSAPAHDTAGSCYAPCMRGVRSYASMAYP